MGHRTCSRQKNTRHIEALESYLTEEEAVVNENNFSEGKTPDCRRGTIAIPNSGLQQRP
jgi:hypothetical protein